MKNLFLILCFVIILFGASYSVGQALFNINPNSVTDVSKLRPINIPNGPININVPALIEEDEDAPLHHPMRASTLMMTEKLLVGLDGTYEKINNTKHFSPNEKKDILDAIKNNKKEATQLKTVIEETHNFENVRNDVLNKLEEFIAITQVNIPKKIIENRIKHKRRILTKLKNVSNKLEKYVTEAKKGGENVEDIETEMTKLNKQLVTADEKLKAVESIKSKIKEDIVINDLRQYREDSDTSLKEVRGNFKEAKKIIINIIDDLDQISK